jgi:hypothetical protein
MLGREQLIFCVSLQVIDCLVKMTEQDGMMIDNGSMFLACDTIINFMSNVSDLIF